MNLIGAGVLKGGGTGAASSSQGSLIDWADKTFGQVCIRAILHM